MSVLEVLKTRTGVKNLLLPNGDRDENIVAFEYIDKKVEVHSLNQECAPLYLEENTKVSILNLEQSGVFLLAVTPNMKQGRGSLVFRIWDSSNVMGFTAKEIQIVDSERQIMQDGKFRCLLNQNGSNSDISLIKLDSLDSLVALRLDNEALIWKAAKKDPHIVSLHNYNSVKLKNCHPNIDIALLQVNGDFTLVAGEIGYLSVWNLDGSDGLSSKSCPIPQRSSGNLSVPHRFTRISKSKLLFNDDSGKVWVFVLCTNCIANVKLPGLHTGCHVFAVTNRQQQKDSIVAVCNETHAINLYILADSTSDNSQEVILCQRPLKVIFSIAPINALGFIKHDFILLASSSNRTLTIWRTLASN